MSSPDPVIIEPFVVGVGADFDVGGVMLEVLDRDGNGFRTVLPELVALDAVLKVMGAIARLRGYGEQLPRV